MKKNVSFTFGLSLLLAVVSLSGCKSPETNPAGVYGSNYGGTSSYGALDGGSIPMANRFSGGLEHPGMFSPVYFAYDSSQVSATERSKVESIANYLKQNNSATVIIEGHCDERGSREYNLALGERRALAVRTYLIDLGISAERIQTKSYGEEKPANPGHDEAAWTANRRAEFVLYY
ncbi:MAG: peptidoglycan-associated lipoprotein [Verrucomicrobiota bacterium]|jgi:peptidoglycan-associated lipoprotein|nr:peptidoglycan-associated lipoprotein [Verrucomicrobiota bacterium]MDK2963454.1 peptidoglycan-associated lipoprotein [Verrucomicrobiota bacterium]